jgi:hypothetical protein
MRFGHPRVLNNEENVCEGSMLQSYALVILHMDRISGCLVFENNPWISSLG